MVKNKKYLLIISLAIFILLIMPISYATDINTDANNDLGHYNNISSISNDDIIIDNSIDEIQTNDYNNKYNDEFNDEFNGNNIVSDREFGNYEKDIGSISKSSQSSKENILYDDEYEDNTCINIQNTELEIEEGGNAVISGDINVDDRWTYYYELNIRCEYTDFSGTLRAYESLYDGYKFTFNTNSFEGLQERDEPYILTFSVVEDSLLDEFNEFYYDQFTIKNATVYLTIKSNQGGETIFPTYDSFTPAGQIFIAQDGNDSNEGDEENPLASIEAALAKNKALGGSYEIIIKNGTYYIDERLDIENNVKIRGIGDVELSNDGSGALFFISGIQIVEFDNLKITNGREAAISMSSTSYGNGSSADEGKVLNIINCTFLDNSGQVGVIISYAKTTILNSTFKNNQATGNSGGWQGLINSREGTLTVNYCNFIDNTVRSGKPLIYANNKANADYNFWGTNSGPNSTDINDNVIVNKWLVLFGRIDAEEVLAKSNYNITISYKYTNGSCEFNDLEFGLANLELDVESVLGEIYPNKTTISSPSKINYISNEKGDEIISIFLNGKEITVFEFEVKPAIYDRIYVSNNGNDENMGTYENPLKTINAALLKNKEMGGKKTIIILNGIYSEHDLEISDEVTIIGESKSKVIIDGNKEGRILVVDANADIYNISFINGLIESFDEYDGNGGGIFHNSGNLNIYECGFEDNIAYNGGAIASSASTEYSIRICNSSFKNNFISTYSNQLKGSVLFLETKSIIDNCEFTQSKFNELGIDTPDEVYGTIYIGSSANISNSNFTNNIASEGGALYIETGDYENITIENNQFINNSAALGGAIYVLNSNLCSIKDNSFNDNNANKGGAIYLYGIKTKNQIYDNVFIRNANDAIYVKSAKLDLENNTIENIAGNDGNNSIASIINENGFISNIVLKFLNNETVKLSDGEIELNVSLTDDNDNLINGGAVSIISNGETIGTANIINGSGILTYPFTDGNYTISGTYSGTNDDYPAGSIKTGLLRINVKNYWFINETGYETLQEAVDAAEMNDVIKGIPGEYSQDEVQIGHRPRPSEPWEIYKNITITSQGEDPIILYATGENIFNIDYSSNLTFRNIVFANANNPDGWGGAIYSMGKSEMLVENCTFIDNYAYDGAGIHAWGKLTIRNCDFINNRVSVYGGAIFKDGDGDLIVENVRFINNSAYTYAGAVYTMGYSEINQTFINVLFDGNDASCGGALFTAGKNVSFIDCNFTNNKAINKGSGYEALGGAVYVHHGATNFTNVNFINNYAEGNGGALELDNGVLSTVDSTGRHITIYWAILNNCTIENNTALGDGGAIYTCEFLTHVNMTNSLIKSNTARDAALFVNILGEYFLKNVTVENSINMEGEYLIYSYGMYSLPESYIANTTIVNCTIKNDASDEDDEELEYILFLENEYTNAYLNDTIFENLGIILLNIGGNATLSNITEINPKENISIINKGNLSLYNNNFINPINNDGDINTPTYLLVLNNETIYGTLGDTIEIFADIYDDNGNRIIGNRLLFIINETSIESTMLNNRFIGNYTVKEGKQYIDASYSDTGLLDLTYKNGLIIGKEKAIINAEDIEINLTGQLEVILTNNESSAIKNTNITLIIKDYANTSNIIIEINRTTDNNGKATFDLELEDGNYMGIITFNGDNVYNRASQTINILVNKLATPIEIGLNDGNLYEDLKININLPDDANGTISIIIEDKSNISNIKNYDFEVINGKTDISIPNLDMGDYSIAITYSGDSKYSSATYSDSFKIGKAKSYVNILVGNNAPGEDAIVYLTVPSGASGYIIVTINGKEQLTELVDSKAEIIIYGIEIGKYTVFAEYMGDEKYLNSSKKISFNVNDGISEFSVINIINISDDGLITGILKDGTNTPIPNALIVFTINNIENNTTTDNKGMFKIAGVANSDILIEFRGFDELVGTNTSIKLGNVVSNGLVNNRKLSAIVAKSMNTYTVNSKIDGKTGKYFTITLKDGENKVLANKQVQFIFNNKIYKRTTNAKGQAKLKIALASKGTYAMTILFLGDGKYNGSIASAKIKVKAQKVKLTVPKKTFKATAKVKKLTATLKNSKGKAIKGKKITFIVNGKKYTAKTNKKGVATVKVKLSKKKTYKATVKFAGDKTYNKISKRSKVKVK